MGDYPHAIEYLVDESRVFIDQNSHSAIALHCTGSTNPDQTAPQLGNYFRGTPFKTSVHYGIDRAGVICQYVLEKDGAGGNGIVEAGHDVFWDQFDGDNLNWHTLSIECVNDETNSLPLTDAQKAALFPLVMYLSKKYSIAANHIKSHASIAPQSRSACPGPAFPWDELFTFLKQEEEPMGIDLSTPHVADFFEAAPGGAWKCKQTGFVVGGAINTFYRTLGNSGLCGLTHLGLPTSNETSANIAGHPEIVYQAFERGVCAYDPAHIIDSPPGAGSVYIVHRQIVDQTALNQAHSLVIDLSHKIQMAQEALK